MKNKCAWFWLWYLHSSLGLPMAGWRLVVSYFRGCPQCNTAEGCLSAGKPLGAARLFIAQKSKRAGWVGWEVVGVVGRWRRVGIWPHVRRPTGSITGVTSQNQPQAHQHHTTADPVIVRAATCVAFCASGCYVLSSRSRRRSSVSTRNVIAAYSSRSCELDFPHPSRHPLILVGEE